MKGRAIVCGGSVGGLFAAAALRKSGWEVKVLERTETPLAGRGAGIVTHSELLESLRQVGAATDELGIEVRERVAYDLLGNRVYALNYNQVVTSWDRMYQVLRAKIPDEDYILGREVAGYIDEKHGAAVCLESGCQIEADLIVGADGFRSAIRTQMLPEVRPAYSGYVVWRTVAAESALPRNVREDIFDTFGFFVPNGTQVVGYPIAGPGNDLSPGNLRYNFVWYVEVPQIEIESFLTDASGRLHAFSIPPPLVRDDLVARIMLEASRRLPKPFADILHAGERPFFTPIYDHHSPLMAKGRIALLGDAACVARPHVGMGVTKAAGDSLTLARYLSIAPLEQAMNAYSTERVAACRIAYETGQRLGRYIFGSDPAVNQDGRSHPDMETVLRESAVVPPALREVQARNSS
ncbi:MAG: hypothetical protein OXI87_02240 [Albidovulum sp.]|nr:hypothetical protein [Albidovulum sp.]MDE0303695.1 hypothetical protein [Albidovulum sp.]MDE0533201.1 hypothetical protein [Albidovulum sp.]